MPNLSTDLELLADWCAAAFPDSDHRRRPLLSAINSMIAEAARLEWSAGERPAAQYERVPLGMVPGANVVPMVRR